MPESLTQASIDAHSAVGRLVARRPREVLAASLAACALLIAPIAQLTVETDYEVLWLPLSSETFQVKKRDVEIFGSQPRPNSLLLRAVAADGAYETRAAPFFRSVLPVAWRLHQQVLHEVTDDTGALGFDDVCIRLPEMATRNDPADGSPCFLLTPFGYWRGNGSRVVDEATSGAAAATVLRTEHARDEHGLRILREQVVMSSAHADGAGGAIDDEARAVLLIYPTQDVSEVGQAANQSSLAWEAGFMAWAAEAKAALDAERKASGGPGVEIEFMAWRAPNDAMDSVRLGCSAPAAERRPRV